MFNHRRSQGLVSLHSFRKSLFRIVTAMLKRAFIEIADARLRRRMRVDVIDVPAGGADSAPSDATKQFGLVDTNIDGHQRRRLAEDGKMCVQPSRLGERAGKA